MFFNWPNRKVRTKDYKEKANVFLISHYLFCSRVAVYCKKSLLQGLKINHKKKEKKKPIHVWFANTCKLGHGNKCKCYVYKYIYVQKL